MTARITILPTLAVAFLLMSACASGPEPINYGKDACDHCRMTIMDSKFGAELVTSKGKVFKFDDVNCMVNFGAKLPGGLDEAAHVLVADMEQPFTLVPVQEACFVRADEVRSPMGSRVAAFGTEANCSEHMANWQGERLDWQAVRSIFE